MSSTEIRKPSTTELVAMVASFMALNALGIDIMLPALPDIAADFGVAREADEQFMLLVYVLSFGAAQLVYGPLSDARGRRPVLLWSMLIYVGATLACMLAPSYGAFLAARAVQGATAAAARVIAVAIVRDLMAGREMARVMSLAMVVFMVAPILAPGIGQIVLLFGPWRWTFGFLLVAGVLISLWTWARLPETRPPEVRTRFSVGAALASYAVIMRDRTALGYTIATSILFGALFGFLATAQPIFAEVFGLGPWFPVAFGIVALAMSMASFVNSHFVMKLGMRRMSHAALIAFTGISAIHVLFLVFGDPEPLWRYLLLLGPAMLMFGMIGSNFSAIVMEPLGTRAGAGAAFYGFAGTTGSAVVGGVIGQFYDGTAAPLIVGQTCVGVLALAVVWITERGRLFSGKAGG